MPSADFRKDTALEAEMLDTTFDKHTTPIAPSTLSQGELDYYHLHRQYSVKRRMAPPAPTNIALLVRLRKAAAMAYARDSRHWPRYCGVADTLLPGPSAFHGPSRQPRCRY
jgi:hypothetical protein